MKILTLVFSLMTLFTLICFVEYKDTSMHETIHANIYETYGYESEIEVGFFGGVTRANITHSDMIEMDLAHTINDVVGYHMISIRFVLYAILLIMIFNLMKTAGG